MIPVEFLRPSGASTWAICELAVAMRALFPQMPDEADTDVCEDGTAAHWLASEIWNGNFPKEGSLSPNNRVITDEMFDGVDLYHDVLRDAFWRDAETYCEQMQDCSIIYPGMKGTPDAFSLKRDADGVWHLRVVDFKFGYRFVEVWHNLQLIIYAAALAVRFSLPTGTRIQLVIVQPRCNHRDGPVRTWNTTIDGLAHHVNHLRLRAEAAMGPNPVGKINPGCIDCAGRHACETLKAAGYDAVHVSYGAIPLDATPEQIGGELTLVKHAIKVLEARESGLEMQADAALRKGVNIPGWALYPTFARESWKEGGNESIIALEKYYPSAAGKLTKPIKAITPAQARKVLPANIVAMWAHKPSTGVRLTKLDPLAAEKAFSQQPE